MNPIERQREIINQLYHLLHFSAPTGYSEAACRFKYFKGNDGSISVDEQFWYFSGDEKISAFLNDDSKIDPLILIPQLHSIMKAHTGGDWHAFTLFIEEDGRVRTKFEYAEQD